MEKINTEILVSSLFSVGFDKVDSILFVYTLARLSVDNHQFTFEDSITNQKFNKYVDYDGNIYKLKPGVTLNTMVSYNDKKFCPLKKLLNINSKLVEYLSQLDFEEIVSKKAKVYGVEKIEQIDKSIFSLKEIEILYNSNLFQNNNKTLNLKNNFKNIK